MAVGEHREVLTFVDRQSFPMRYPERANRIDHDLDEIERIAAAKIVSRLNGAPVCPTRTDVPARRKSTPPPAALLPVVAVTPETTGAHTTIFVLWNRRIRGERTLPPVERTSGSSLYEDGLYRLRHIKPAYQGRLIFFAVDRAAGFERLVILTVYKKQSQKAPASVLETAKRRKKQWEEERDKP